MEAVVDVSQEPYHHRVLENGCVKVFRVEVPPGVETLLHHHARDYAFVNLGESETTNQVPGQPAVDSQARDGDVHLVKAPLTHKVRNRGVTLYRNVVAEIVATQPQKPAAAGSPACGARAAGVTSKLLFETEVVRAWETRLDPGATPPRHEHQHDYLLVAVSEVELRDDVESQEPRTIRQKPGEVAWVEAPRTHTLTNLSCRPARFVILEFK